MKSSRNSPIESTAFKGALRKVLQVSKNDLDGMLKKEKLDNEGKPKRGPKPKTSASDRASDSGD
jgi:hypothetical protein